LQKVWQKVLKSCFFLGLFFYENIPVGEKLFFREKANQKMLKKERPFARRKLFI
jgi:hypothetical protein